MPRTIRITPEPTGFHSMMLAKSAATVGSDAPPRNDCLSKDRCAFQS